MGDRSLDESGSGWLWIVIDVVLVIALGLALYFGYARWRSNWKSPDDRRRERDAIKDVYREDTK